MNVLKPHLQTTIRTLLQAGASQREIERVTGIDRKTIRAYQQRFPSEVQANGRRGLRAALLRLLGLWMTSMTPPSARHSGSAPVVIALRRWLASFGWQNAPTGGVAACGAK